MKKRTPFDNKRISTEKGTPSRQHASQPPTKPPSHVMGLACVSFSRIGSTLLTALLLICRPCVAAEPEVRGTWLTTTANDAISTPAKTEQTMRRLAEIGINTVYLECWKDGYTEFPSESMQKLIGVPLHVNAAPPQLQRDLLQEGIIQAHRQGLLVIGWFEYGFMAANKTIQNPLRSLGEKEGWLLRNAKGDFVSRQDNFVWMNPLHPKAQQILLDVVLDAARKYDLDGVQLDDRISMPTEMGYDDYTQTLYAKEHAGKRPPRNAKDPEWIQWRADKITAFARRFSAAVHQVNPNLIVSASPAPYPWCYDNFACDWPTWMKWTGPEKWDECIPQNYRMDFTKTKESIREGFSVIGNRRHDLLAGIRIVGDGPDMTDRDLIQGIQFARSEGLGGHVLWFSRGILDVYPDQLKAFYDVQKQGRACNPLRPADWRTPSVAARKASDGLWHFKLETSAKYQIIAKQNDTWLVAKSSELPAGEGTYSDNVSTEIEIVIDRRP
jgi:uncharacterized lipoprotein YddW (UPF0748 family)